MSSPRSGNFREGPISNKSVNASRQMKVKTNLTSIDGENKALDAS